MAGDDRPLLVLAEGHGILAWARAQDIRRTYDPARGGVLSRVAAALSPREARGRLLAWLTAPVEEALKAVRDSRLGVVLRAYGNRVAHYLRDEGPVGGSAPARSVLPGATGAALSAAAGRDHRADRLRASAAGETAEYRNFEGLDARQESEVRSALRDHDGWTTLVGWFSAQTAHFPVSLPGVPQSGNHPDRHVFVSPSTGDQVPMDRGLFLTVASGVDALGRPSPSAGRSTFMGRRVGVLPYDGKDNAARAAALSRTWGGVLLDDFVRSSGHSGPDAIAAARRAGYPLAVGSDGEPLARLVHAARGGNVLLAMPRLGFRDIGRGPGGVHTPNHPDRLEAAYGQGFEAYLRASLVARESRTAQRPANFAAPAPGGGGFAPPFGETLREINPATTAIVFRQGTGRNFDIVHVGTGKRLGLPMVGISNLPRGEYTRLRQDAFQEWEQSAAGTRPSLREVASGTVRVTDGHVLVHLDADGRPHNDYNGPSVVRAAQDSSGSEAAPKAVSWHEHGQEMDEEAFYRLRTEAASRFRYAAPSSASPRPAFLPEASKVSPSVAPAFH